MRFGNTEGEIRVKKWFSGWFRGFWGGLWIRHLTHPYLGKFFQKKRFYFWGAPLYGACQKNVDLGLGMRICRRIPKQSGLKTYYNATKTVIWKFHQKFRFLTPIHLNLGFFAGFLRQWQRKTYLENNFQVNCGKANSKAIWFTVRIVPWIHCTSETQYFTSSIAFSFKKEKETRWFQNPGICTHQSWYQGCVHSRCGNSQIPSMKFCEKLNRASEQIHRL